MAAEFSNYAPVTATYQVVLTRQPDTDKPVTVNITPELTRTYNADLAFDPTSNFGQREAVQVSVNKTQLVFTHDNWDKPQTVTVTALDDSVIDGGDALAVPRLGGRVNGIRGPLTIDGGIRVTKELF